MEILAIAEDVMTEEGVNGLSLSEVARRLGVKPPSIYKYFDSLMSIYDALFEQGQRDHLDAMRDAMQVAARASKRSSPASRPAAAGAFAHLARVQLLFWRPVLSFEPTAAAMAPSVEMVRLQRQALANAVAAGGLGPGSIRRGRVRRLGFVIVIIGQSIANEPGVPWGKGRFSPLFPKLFGISTALYPPQPARRRS